MRLTGLLFRICFGFMLLTPQAEGQALFSNAIEKANTLISTGEFDSAYQLLHTWPNTADLSQGDNFELSMLKTMSSLEARRGKSTREAMAELEQVILTTPQAIVNKPEHRLTLSEIYFKQGQNHKGCTCLETIPVAGIQPSSALYVRYLFLTGICYSGQNTDSAVAYLQAALDLLNENKSGPSWLEAKIRRALGNELRDRDPEAAVQYYLKDAQILEMIFTPGHLEIAGAHYNAANVYFSLMEYTRALEEYKIAYPGFSKRYQPGDRYMRFINEAIGDMFWELGQKDSALVYYDRSVIGEDPVNHDHGEKLNASADSLLRSGFTNQALKYYRSALAFRQEQFGTQHPLTGACNNFVARVYQRQGQTEEAMRIYQQSLMGFSADFLDTSLYSNPTLTQMHIGSEQYALEALLAKAEGFVKRYNRTQTEKDIDAAQQTIDLCLSLIERSRSFPLTEGSRMFRSDMAQPVYALAVRMQILRYNGTKDEQYLQFAFQTLEKSKAYTLVQAMQYDAKAYRDLPAHMLEREKAMKKAIADYSGKIVREEKRCDETRDKKLVTWKNELEKLYSEYSAFLRTVKSSFPAYYSMRHSMDVVSLSELQKIIGRETLVLSLFQGEDVLSLFAVTRDSAIVREFPIDSLFLKRTETLLQLLKAPAAGGLHQKESWQEICSLIYSTCFAETIEMFRDKKRLIVLPDGVMAYFPFELFIAAGYTDVHSSEALNVLQSLAISYAHSATVLAESIRQPMTGINSFTGIAPSYGGINENMLRGSNQLKYNILEVNQLALLFRRPKIYTGELSHDLFLEKCASAEILHLAMHAEIDPEEPMLSAFLLGTGPEENQKVYAYEIQSRSLQARHAVLSACNTGIGQMRKGEGMMSLSRCFQYAGCQSMVVSLWPVDDLATSELMHYYYTHLLAGLPKDVALQRAKLDFLHHADPATSHPYYWAGFVIIGNTDPIRVADPMKWWVWIALVGAGLVLLFSLKKLLKSTHRRKVSPLNKQMI